MDQVNVAEAKGDGRMIKRTEDGDRMMNTGYLDRYSDGNQI